MPPAAVGFPQSPLTEKFETQEVREQLYICEVLHVGLKPQHAAPHKWCQDKSKDFTCHEKKFFGVRPMLLELDLSSGADFHLLLDWFFQYTEHGMQFEEHASQEQQDENSE